MNSFSDIDSQAQELSHRLIEGMKQTQGIIEQLKEENALEWTRRMNNIRVCAREIVNKEIYTHIGKVLSRGKNYPLLFLHPKKLYSQTIEMFLLVLLLGKYLLLFTNDL